MLLAILLLGTCSALGPGTLYISELDGQAVHKPIKLFGNRLYVNYYASAAFQYENENGLKYPDTGEYLGVSSSGWLVLQRSPNAEFVVNAAGSKRVTFGGNGWFQLCGDASIGYESKCKGHQVALSYAEI